MRPLRLRRDRLGLSLVEFIFVMAILAVLVALLLPAVQRTREAARHTQCRNNLKQIGFALQNYHNTYNSFPAGYVLPVDGPYTGWGWNLSLLPYLDQGAVYEKINLQGGLQNEFNRSDLTVPLAALRCPMDRGSVRVANFAVVTTDVREGVVVPAKVNAANIFPRSVYFGVAGYLPAELGGIERDDAGDSIENPGRLGHVGRSYSTEGRYCDHRNFRGVFGQNRYVKIEDIKDGTSNVLMVGERSTPTNIAAGSVGHGTWLGVPDCSTSAGLAAALGDTSVKLNLAAKNRGDSTGFGGAHGLGTVFLLGDGSVRYLNEKIAIATYRDLSTVDDGRQVGDY